MRGRVRRNAVILAVASALVAGAAGAAIDARAAGPGDGVTSVETTTPDPSARQLHQDLRRLERAWSDGGGRFGYPFWEEAGQRWRTSQISAAMYREYVTGYRDSLELGCPLVDAIDLETDIARGLRDRLVEACTDRLDGLRAQDRWLQALIRRDVEVDADADTTDAINDSIATYDEQARAKFEESFRGTREAMDAAQAALDAAEAERIDESAFL